MPFPNRKITRRTMLARTAQATATVAIASDLRPLSAGQSSSRAAGEGVWDMHGHLTGVRGTPQERMARLLEHADRMGIQRLIVFMGYPFVADPSAAIMCMWETFRSWPTGRPWRPISNSRAA